MNTASTNILEYFAKSQEVPTVTVEFVDGFSLDIKFVSQQSLRQMVTQCTVHRGGRTGNRTPDLDLRRFSEKIAGMIVDWRGCTLRRLSKYQLLKPGIPAEILDREVPFNPTTAADLLHQIPAFSNFVQESATDVELFNDIEQIEGELGNSATSPSGDSQTLESTAGSASGSTKTKGKSQTAETVQSPS